MYKIGTRTLIVDKYHGKFLMNVLVGDLLHVEVLMPAISGVDSVSTVTSLPGLGRDINSDSDSDNDNDQPLA